MSSASRRAAIFFCKIVSHSKDVVDVGFASRLNAELSIIRGYRKKIVKCATQSGRVCYKCESVGAPSYESLSLKLLIWAKSPEITLGALAFCSGLCYCSRRGTTCLAAVRPLFWFSLHPRDEAGVGDNDDSYPYEERLERCIHSALLLRLVVAGCSTNSSITYY